MAIQIWNGTGGVPGDLNDAANWSTLVPLASDTIIFPKTTTQGPTTNMSVLSALNFTLILVEDGATYDIGAAGSALECSADKIVHKGQGAFHFKDNGGASITDIVVVDSPNRVNAFNLDGSNCSLLVNLRGKTNVLGTFSAAGAFDVVNGKIASTTDASINVSSGAGTVDTFRGFSGAADISADCTLLELANGADYTQTSGTLTTGRVYGGTARHNTSTTVTLWEIYGGTVDYMKNSNNATITKARIFSGGKLLRDQDLVTITTEEVYGLGFIGQGTGISTPGQGVS